MPFEMEVLLPSQFADRVRRDASKSPERRLMLAVLEEAVNTFQKNWRGETPQARRIFAETEAWLRSDDRTHPFAFANICDSLGFEANYIREGLSRWRDSRLNPASRPLGRTPRA